MKYESVSDLAGEELDQVSDRALRMTLGAVVRRKFLKQLGSQWDLALDQGVRDRQTKVKSTIWTGHGAANLPPHLSTAPQ